MPQIQSHPCFLTPTTLRPDDPLFVFLPGMDGTGQLLRTQTVGLEQGFDIRCLAIPPDDLTSWDVLTEEVVALIEAELGKNAHRPVYLCGESFGGCLAIKVALRAPKLFERVILVNPASAYNRRCVLSWGIPLTRWTPDFFYHLGSILGLPILAAMGRIGASDRQALIQAVQRVPQKTAVWRMSLLKDFDVDDTQLQRITQPVLVIAGGSDRLLPSVAEAEHLVRVLPNAQMLVLPESGHACLLEQDVNLYEIMEAQRFLPCRDERAIAFSPAQTQPVH